MAPAAAEAAPEPARASAVTTGAPAAGREPPAADASGPAPRPIAAGADERGGRPLWTFLDFSTLSDAFADTDARAHVDAREPPPARPAPPVADAPPRRTPPTQDEEPVISRGFASAAHRSATAPVPPRPADASGSSPGPALSARSSSHVVAWLAAAAVAIMAAYGAYTYWLFTENAGPRASGVAREGKPSVSPASDARPVDQTQPATRDVPAAAVPSDTPHPDTHTAAAERVEAPRTAPAAGNAPDPQPTAVPTAPSQRAGDADPIQRGRIDVGPCTEQVAALGLCTPDSNPRRP